MKFQNIKEKEKDFKASGKEKKTYSRYLQRNGRQIGKNSLQQHLLRDDNRKMPKY